MIIIRIIIFQYIFIDMKIIEEKIQLKKKFFLKIILTLFYSLLCIFYSVLWMKLKFYFYTYFTLPLSFCDFEFILEIISKSEINDNLKSIYISQLKPQLYMTFKSSLYQN